MEATVNITRRNLVRFNLSMLPWLWANLIFVGVVALGIFMFITVSDTPDTPVSWCAAAIVSLGRAVVGLLACFAISLVWILFASSGKAGVLRKHIYPISGRGLQERTQANDALTKWSGIQCLLKSNSFIFVRINSYLFHRIPGRAFRSEAEFDGFWERVYAYWKQAA